ncbi:MAG: AEC family transporter [Capsulimonadaceae bacterium]|nr:AEC family transporter [Capsulimonadaceae bacterium]
MSTVLISALPLFSLVGLGYFAKRYRVLHLTDSDVLSRFVMDITLPAFIIDALLSNKIHSSYAGLPLVIWTAQIAVFVLAIAISKLLRYGPKQTGTTALVATFANTGYLGYPMTMALFPTMMPATVIMDQIGMGTPLYPTAGMLGSIYGRSTGQTLRQSVVRVLRSPLFVAMIAGLIIRLIPWPGPPATGNWSLPYSVAAAVAHGIGVSLHYIAGATVPVVLISLGIILRPSALRQCLPQVGVIAILKLVVAPIVGFLVARHVLGIHDHILTAVCVLECSLPPSANATLLSGQYDMDGTLGAAAFFALTLGSALTIPLMLAILH